MASLYPRLPDSLGRRVLLLTVSAGFSFNPQWPGWGRYHIFWTCSGEQVVRLFSRKVRFFQTSIMEYLVVILKIMLSPQYIFMLSSVSLLIKHNWSEHRQALRSSAKMASPFCLWLLKVQRKLARFPFKLYNHLRLAKLYSIDQSHR